MSEIYRSSTHGDIPLSFTGRRLLANLREAIHKAIDKRDFNADDMAVSKARGDIAQYMSKLEAKQPPTIFGCDWGAFEACVLADAMQQTPQRFRSPEQQAADEFIEAAREYNAARAKLTRCAKQANYLGLKTTWINATLPGPFNKPKQFDKPQYFRPLTFEVSRVVKTPRVVEDEHVEVMGRVP